MTLRGQKQYLLKRALSLLLFYLSTEYLLRIILIWRSSFVRKKSHVLIILNLQWNKTKLKQKRQFYVCYARRLKDVNINNKKKEDVIYNYPWDMYPQISKNKDVKNYRNKFTLFRICIISCEKEWIWCMNSWQNITTCSWRKKLEKERKDIILWLLSFI